MLDTILAKTGLERGLLKTIVGLSGLFVLARSVGAFIPLLLARNYGVSAEMDAFFLALSIQTIIGTTLASVCEVSVVPYLVRAEKGDTATFVRSLLLTAPLLTVVLSLCLGMIVARTLPPATVAVYWRLLLYPVFSVGVGIVCGALNARGCFAYTAAAPGLRAVILICLLLAFANQGAEALAMFFTASEFLLLLLMLAAGARMGMFQGKGTLHGFYRYAKSALIFAAGFVFLAMNPMIDKLFASFAGPGGVSVVEYAFAIFYVPANLLTGPLLTVLLSRWSRFEASKQVLREADRVVLTVALISGAMFVGFLVLGKFVLVPVLSKGIRLEAIETIWAFSAILMAGLGPYVAGSIYSRVIIVAGKHTLISFFSFLNAILNCGLNYVFFQMFGLTGVLISTLVTYTAVALLMRVTLKGADLPMGRVCT